MKILVLMLFLCSCTQIAFKAPLIKKTKIEKDSLKVNYVARKRNESQEHYWTALLFFGNVKYPVKTIFDGLEELCKGSDYISDVEVKRTYFFLFPLYMSNKFEYGGNCE